MLGWKRLLIPTKLTKIVYVLVIALSLIVILCNLNSKHEYSVTAEVARSQRVQRHKPITPQADLKYILRWTNPNTPTTDTSDGSLLFRTRKCRWNNCYFTDRADLLADFRRFNVILFNSPDIEYFTTSGKLPKRRMRWQKFVFVSGDSAAMYPICDTQWNGYFNWTWTYKFDSDLVWHYIVIRDAYGKIIGPKPDMNWLKIQQMAPVDSRYIMKLRSKTKIAAWFIPTCGSESQREEFVNEVQGTLREYDLQVDIYGKCGTHECPKGSMEKCFDMLSAEYYFYFAFESSMSSDYVTDIVLHALQHDTVPVVYGGANYTRFLPDGSYLNALHYGPERLARRMYEIMQNPSMYQMFFRWRNHYSYHAHSESPETDNYCKLCAAVNDEKKTNVPTSRTDFLEWWNIGGRCTDRFVQIW